MKAGFLVGVCAMFFASTAYAQQEIPRIRAVPAVGAEIAEIARTSEQFAEGTVDGRGRFLRMTYRADVPLTGLVAPLLSEGAYNRGDMLRFTMPASTEEHTIDVDLSSSPSWNPQHDKYFIAFASASPNPPQISQIGILSASLGEVFSAAVSHATTPEAFVVSTYHALRGYRILGTSVLWMFLVLLFGGVVWALVLRKNVMLLLVVVLAVHLLYGARVGVDQLRLSGTHLSQWYGEGMFAEAGDTYAVADAVREIPDATLAVCFDSTDYFAKLLRYLLLPGSVVIGTEGQAVTHVAVVRKIDWSFENGTLRCGTIDAPAREIKAFPGGSHLFELTP